MIHPIRLFTSFLGYEGYLGVDIGTTSIKIVEVHGVRGKPKFTNYGILESQSHLERTGGAIQTSDLKLVDKDTGELLKLILKQSKFTAKRVIASLPSFSAFTDR